MEGRRGPWGGGEGKGGRVRGGEGDKFVLSWLPLYIGEGKGKEGREGKDERGHFGGVWYSLNVDIILYTSSGQHDSIASQPGLPSHVNFLSKRILTHTHSIVSSMQN